MPEQFELSIRHSQESSLNVATTAASRLYHQTQSAVVKLETERGSGSGFFVDDNGHIATAAHVVLNASEIFAITSTGEKFRARLEKLDDISDIAELKLENFDKRPQNFLEFGTSKDLFNEQPLAAVGHPRGATRSSSTTGNLTGKIPMYEMVDKDEVARQYAQATPLGKKDWLEVLARTVLQTKILLEPGNSGGPLIDPNGHVVGMAQSIRNNNKSESIFAPVEDLQRVVPSPADKFAFVYAHTPASYTQSFIARWLAPPTNVEGSEPPAKSWSNNGMAFLSLASQANSYNFYAYTAATLGDDLQDYRTSTYSRDRLKHGLSTAFDFTILAGAATSLLPGLEAPSMLARSCGLAGRISTDFIPNRLLLSKIQRLDGDTRPPFGRQTER